MAIFRSTIFDNVRRKLANTVMFRRYSKGIMRSNPGTIRNPRTPEQLVQRAKMSLLVDLARRMAPVINVGFKPLATKQTVHNAFVQANVPFVKVDEDFNATLAPDQMLCSDGVLKRPKVTATWNESDNKLVLQHAAEKVSGLCALDDKIYAGLYETGLREAVLVELGNRKSETAEQTELPEEWNKENLCIYAFAISLSKRNASPSVCVELL